jgi:hypothetical protein
LTNHSFAVISGLSFAGRGPLVLFALDENAGREPAGDSSGEDAECADVCERAGFLSNDGFIAGWKEIAPITRGNESALGS